MSKRQFNIAFYIIPVALAAGMFVSCNNQEVDTFSKLSTEAPENMDTVTMRLYQRGNSVAILKAPRIERYHHPAKTVFPLGLVITHYDSLMQPEAKLEANRGIYREADQKFEVFQDVVLHNFIENQILKTEYLIWERLPNDSSKVHTNEMVRIFDGENVHQADQGLNTDAKLSWYSFIGYSSILEGKTDSLFKQ